MPPAVAEMSDVDRVADALKDVRRYWSALLCIRSSGGVAFAVVAKDAQLEHIVGLTQWLASPSHPSLMTPQSWLVDSAVFDAISRCHKRSQLPTISGLLDLRMTQIH